jgi:hypothetical protein
MSRDGLRSYPTRDMEVGKGCKKKGCGSGLDRDRNMSGSITIKGCMDARCSGRSQAGQRVDTGFSSATGARMGGSSCGEGLEGSRA